MSMNRLSPELRTQVLAALVEGVSIRGTARLTGVSKPTILKLLLDAGRACMAFEDSTIRNLIARRIEIDEIWGFNHAKDRNLPESKRGQFGFGSVWTWYAIDADTKLIISWIMGDHDAQHANGIMQEVAARVAIRPQISTDALHAYAGAVARAFGTGGVDYATVSKVYESPIGNEARYSAPKCVDCEKRRVFGNPDESKATTSHVEAANLQLRMRQRRWTRLTNAHSKSFDHMQAAFAVHTWHYNFCRVHTTTKQTPAMAASIADRKMTLADLVDLIAAQEGRKAGRPNLTSAAARRRLHTNRRDRSVSRTAVALGRGSHRRAVASRRAHRVPRAA